MAFEFSNFQPAVVYDAMGIAYPTVEHYYQAQKSTDRAERLDIASRPTAAQAKRWGRTLTLRPDWEQFKEPAMYLGLVQKFQPGTEHAKKLLATGNAEIVELNTWHDNFWGRCTCGRCALRGEGRNMLGGMLMLIRDQLRSAPRTPEHREVRYKEALRDLLLQAERQLYANSADELLDQEA